MSHGARQAWLIGLVVAASSLAEETGPPLPAGREASTPTGVVGIEVRIRGPMSFPTYDADAVYFERRCGGEDTCEPGLVPSAFARKGRAYLLEAEPGTYVAVAAVFRVLGTRDRYVVYFPAAVIDATETVVTDDGRRQFAGSFLLGTSIGLCPESAEPVQLEYAERIYPGSDKCGIGGIVMDTVGRGDSATLGGMPLLEGGVVYHYRGLLRETHREPADLQRLAAYAEADLDANQRPNSRRTMR